MHRLHARLRRAAADRLDLQDCSAGTHARLRQTLYPYSLAFSAMERSTLRSGTCSRSSASSSAGPARGSATWPPFHHRAAHGHHDLEALPGAGEVALVHLALVIQPVGHLLDVGGHVQVVVHGPTAGAGAGPGHRPPAAAGQHLRETVRTLGADAALAPPVIHFGNIRRAGAALHHAAHPVGELDGAGHVVRGRMGVGQFCPAPPPAPSPTPPPRRY